MNTVRTIEHKRGGHRRAGSECIAARGVAAEITAFAPTSVKAEIEAIQIGNAAIEGLTLAGIQIDELLRDQPESAVGSCVVMQAIVDSVERAKDALHEQLAKIARGDDRGDEASASEGEDAAAGGVDEEPSRLRSEASGITPRRLTQRLNYLTGVADMAAAIVHEGSDLGDGALGAVLNGLRDQLSEALGWASALEHGEPA
ncbi:MAG: hypothetical protein HY749_15915 [Gammaproteobacteria bacterium]|nr:hypothetical protein [Gammaproteobacteria bacterium]